MTDAVSPTSLIGRPLLTLLLVDLDVGMDFSG